MRISQIGAPSVCLSSHMVRANAIEEPEFIAVNVPIKIEDKSEEDGPIVAMLQLSGRTALEGRAIENRSPVGWLLFKIPRGLCAEGGSLTFCALADEVLLWQKEYRVVWRDRFPGLEPAA